MRLPKTLNITRIEFFNVWDTIIKSNATEYQDQIEAATTNGIECISLEYFGRGSNGNYIIADSHGYFTMFRKSTEKPKNGSETNLIYKLISRSYSGVKNIKLIRRQNALTIFSDGNHIGFLRAIDGQIASSACEVGTNKIVSISHDKNSHSRFYVGTESGDIIVFLVRSSDKNNIGCDVEGKIIGDKGSDYSIYALNQFLIKYHPEGLFHIYNTTEAKLNPSMAEFAKVNFVKYKPSHLRNNLNTTEDIEIFETPSQQGNRIAVRVPGVDNQIIVLEIINPEIRVNSWAMVIVDNKAFVFAFAMIIVFGYQCYFKGNQKIATPKKDISKAKSGYEAKNNEALDQLAEKLKGLDMNAEMIHKMTSDSMAGLDPIGELESMTGLAPTPKRHAQKKYGNKVDFLE